MLIAIDVGNTNITIGIFKNDKIVGNYRLTTKMQRTSDEFGLQIIEFLGNSNVNYNDINDVIISSVVPKINYSLSSAVIKYLHKTPIFVTPTTHTGINIRIDNPSEIGVDRLVDAVGAYYIYGGPCIVIDFGTATTYDVVSEQGEFLGGVTSAGIGITAYALSSQLAQLPEIEIMKPKKIIATDTIKSMQAGVVYAYIGQTEYIIKEIKKEYGKDMHVISTGGIGKVVSSETKMIDFYDRDLTFKGLKKIYEIIKQSREG